MSQNCITKKGLNALIIISLLGLAGCGDKDEHNGHGPHKPLQQVAGKGKYAVELETIVETATGHIATFHVGGMVCIMCEGKVRKTISQIAGVNSVEASKEDSHVVVNFDPKATSAEKIKLAIESIK